MPSAANAKSEKPASSEAMDNSPIRQIITILEHKIRNLEKRKSKLTSYRDLQKAGKELNADQKIAVAKYDEVAQTLEFARDLSKQVTSIATSAEREAKKQAKKEAWVRYAAETGKIREVLLILDCLMQMGNTEAREDFMNGTNGAAKLSEEDLKILDDLYPEVTPKHETNEEGQPAFAAQTTKAAEHLYAIIDGKPKEVLGTTYAHIKEIVATVHDCGYFDKTVEVVTEIEQNCVTEAEGEAQEATEGHVEPEVMAPYPPPTAMPAPPGPGVVPAPAYPMCPLPPITLQEVEHAYFTQQYPQQRQISDVIGSQNFYFIQESEIDSPVGTPQPPPIMNQPSPPMPIPSQTFTNQHYVLPPQPHFPPRPEHTYPGVPLPAPMPGPHPEHTAHPSHVHPAHPPQHPHPSQALHPGQVVHSAQPTHPAQPVQSTHLPQAAPAQTTHPMPTPPTHTTSADHQRQPEETKTAPPVEDKIVEDEWIEDSKERQSPEREEGTDRKSQGQGDGQNRYRRYGRGGRPSNGYRGRGGFQNRQSSDGYHGRQGGEYQNRSSKDGYQSRQYNDGYQNRHKDGYQSRNNDGYYGNGDTSDGHAKENGTRDRYNDNSQSYGGGFKGRGRGAPRGGGRRVQHYTRKQDNVE